MKVVETPQDLQEELVLIQLVAPPSETNIEYESGVYLYIPDLADQNTVLFTEGLIFKTDESGNFAAPVSIFEDLETHDTVYLNSENEIIFRFPPLYGYNPYWVIEALYPQMESSDLLLDLYHPSRVMMKAVLLPVDQEEFSSLSGKNQVLLKNDIENTNYDSGAVFETENGIPGGESDLVVKNAGGLNSKTNRSTFVSRKKKVIRAIYVDRTYGNDSWNGKAKIRVVDNGPKKSIKEGLKTVKGGGRVYVAKGMYLENINVRGKNVRVRIDGAVVLAEKPKHKSRPDRRVNYRHSSVQTNLTSTVSKQ
ncbi:MAG: hypothetical protein R6V06_08525 [Kiritimatiellia bacterium]